MNMQKNSKIVLLLAVLIAGNLLLWTSNTLARKNDAFEQIGLLTALRRELVVSHVEEPDQDKMLRAAVQGMISSLDDPYTTYLFPEDMKQFDKHVRGTFSGIGAEVIIDETLNRVKIVSPLEESPAWGAGVLAGDIIYEIDGTDTEGLSINDAVDKLTGPEGTPVTIVVRHKTGEKATITITRARINIQTVKGFSRDKDHHWNFMLDDKNKVGYIRLTQFNENSGQDMRKALEELNTQGAKSVILDLRFDPGGLLPTAIEVADMFLPAGEKIVSVKGRVVPESTEYSTDEGTVFKGEVVVLANESSASASEIVTGALHDNHRAKFIGTRTFGKGSVQQIRPLASGEGALKITNAYYYLPNGEKIHRVKDAKSWGVNPDPGFYVAMKPQEITDMIKIRREGDVLNDSNGEDHLKKISPEWIRENLKDIQLAAGLEAAIGKISTGEWPKVGTDGSEEVRNGVLLENLIRTRELLQERMDEVNKQITKIESGEKDDDKAADKTADASTKTDEKKEEPVVVPAQ
jgi:carboxyl-terminal processing protease